MLNIKQQLVCCEEMDKMNEIEYIEQLHNDIIALNRTIKDKDYKIQELENELKDLEKFIVEKLLKQGQQILHIRNYYKLEESDK